MQIFYGLLLPFIALCGPTFALDLEALSATPLESRWPAVRLTRRAAENGGMLLSPRQMQNVTTVAEHSIYLNCPINSNSKDEEKLEWRRESQILPANHGQFIFPNGTLLVEKVDTRLDAGVYQCKRGPTILASYNLQVIIPPRIDPLTFPADLSPGARVRVSCSVSRGDPPISISWFKDGRDLSLIGNSDLRDMVVQDIDEYASFLVISSLNVDHAGNYTCLASNRAAQDAKTARLTVNVPVYWIHEPTDAVAVHKTDVQLTCQASGNPAPVIEWKKASADSLGNYTPVASDRIDVWDNGTLVIRDLERTDQGSYLCQATNGIGPAISKVVHLAVKAPAYFLKDKEVVPVSIGLTATLTCHAFGDLPIAIVWFHKDRALSGLPLPRLSIHTQNTVDGIRSILTVLSTERGDSGEYVCKVTNGFGDAKKAMILKVQEFPEAPMSVAKIATNSRMVQLGWIAGYDGNSPVINFILEWRRPDQLWTDDGVQREYTPGNATAYTVKNLHPDTPYDMRLRASNVLGQSKPSELIAVRTDEEPPSESPGDALATPKSSTTIHLTWKPPPPEAHNGQLRSYNVGYRLTNSTHNFANKTVEINRERSVLFEGLQKFAAYDVLVEAVNSMGSGPPALLTAVRTLEDVPSEAPSTVTATALSSQRISVTWDQLPQESINGFLLGYKVLFKPLTEWTAQPNVRTVHETGCVLDHLKKFTNYTIQVLAYTKMGDGAKSQSVHVQTHEDVPSAPHQIKAVIKSPTSVLITWTDPLEKNGIIKLYNVYMRSATGKREREKKRVYYPDGSLNRHEFTDLVANEQYDFWVSGETEAGEGVESQRVQQKPASVAPARIASFGSVVSQPLGSTAMLHCLAVGLPSPTVEWIKGGQQISGMLSNGSFVLRNLKTSDAGNYVCRVQNRLNTEFIDIRVVVQREPDAPVVVVSESTSDSLTVDWKVVNDGGSPVKEFGLSYGPANAKSKSIRLPGSYSSYTFQHLDCGRKYHVNMTAFNEIGTSMKSIELTASTDGRAPLAPELKDFLIINSTSALTLLSSWDNGGCPVKGYSLKYQAYYESEEWKTIGGMIPGAAESFFIEDLKPETVYRLKMAASNEAGTTEKEYTFSTLTENGEVVMPDVVLQKEQSVLAFHEDPIKILPLIVCILIAAFAVIALGLLFHRRKQQKFRADELETSTNLRRDLTSDGFRYDVERTPRKSASMQSPWRNISHYAEQNNHSPVSLASTPKQWQPPLRNNEYTFSSPKRLNTVVRSREARSFTDPHSHYQTPSNRTLIRDESTPDSGFSGSNLKQTDCESFPRESFPRLSTGSHSDSDGATHKLDFNAHKTRPKPAQRRRLPTRNRHNTSSLPRTKPPAPVASSSSPSSTEDLPYAYPICTNRPRNPSSQPQIHFPSPPHSDDDRTPQRRSGNRPKIPVRKDAFNLQRYSVNAADEFCLDDLVDTPLQPTTTV